MGAPHERARWSPVMMYDAILKNGLHFDGTGAPGALRHLGLRGGRVVVASAEPLDEAGCPRVIDARGKWVMPGFVDVHTHYDAELIAAPSLSESVRHGVTTVTVGSCSISAVLADPEDCSDLFTRVESVPREHVLPLLRAQKTWSSTGRLCGVPPAASARAERGVVPRSLGSADAGDGARARRRPARAADGGRAEGDGAPARGRARQRLPRDVVDDEPVGQARRGPLPVGEAAVDVRDVGRVPAAARGAAASRAHPAERAERRHQGELAAVPAGERGLGRAAAAQDDAHHARGREVEPRAAPRARAAGALREPRLGGDMRWQALPVPFEVYSDGIDLVVFEEFGAGRPRCTSPTRSRATS
jgi:hypothetical protein